MTERAYTVKELDKLRAAVEQRWLYGTTKLTPGMLRMSCSYKEEEKTKCVEQIVRTHMLAGHTARDLYDEDNKPYPLPDPASLSTPAIATAATAHTAPAPSSTDTNGTAS